MLFVVCALVSEWRLIVVFVQCFGWLFDCFCLRLLRVVCFPVIVARCSLHVRWWSLVVVSRLLFVGRCLCIVVLFCLVFVECCLWCVDCCVLFVDCGVLFVLVV